MAYMAKYDSAGCDGLLSVCCYCYLAFLLPPLSPTAGQGDRAATAPPLLHCFEEEYRANMTLAASLLLIVSFLPPSHVSPKHRFVVTCELRKPLLTIRVWTRASLLPCS